MASSTTNWIVRATGNDANGGGFDSTLGGVDYTNQDSPQATGTATSSSTTLTATTGIFTSQMVGNYVTNGTTWKLITAYTSSTVVTLESAPTWTSQTIKVGGGLATPSKGLALMVNGNKLFIKNGSYSQSANPTIGPTGTTPGSGTPHNVIEGFNSTPGDRPTGATRPTITATSGCTSILPISTTGWNVSNLILDCNSIASTGISITGAYSNINNVWVKGFIQYGINLGSGNQECFDCELSGGTSAATCCINVGFGGKVQGNTCHDSLCHGIINAATGGPSIDRNLIYNLTGTNNDGIQNTGYDTGASWNTVYNVTRDGIRDTSGFNITRSYRNNLLVSCGGYGLNFLSSTVDNLAAYDGNAFYNNTLGNRPTANGTGIRDIILSAIPFTNAGAGDFSLNSTAGGGAAVKAAGFPSNYGSTNSYLDMGAIQSQGSAAGPVARILSVQNIGTY